MSSAAIAISPMVEEFALLPICFDGSRSPHCLSGSQLQDSIIIFLAVPGAPPMPMSVLGSESIASGQAARFSGSRGSWLTSRGLCLMGTSWQGTTAM
ncbi:hypothetical protein EE612_033881 [Oryza sativa]|nr:hypothetical protein EE612_033881 [Oryza sativa]KAB8102379.1 hypothetical protein EE612_033881 [Oryza sativa]